MSSNDIDDAALARMLHELEVQEARFTSQRNLNEPPPPPPVAPSAPVYDSFSGTAATSAASSSSDEEYARELQAELRRSSRVVGRPAPPDSPEIQRDVAFARKVEQEMLDEEMARNLERSEQDEAAAGRRSSRAQQRPSRGRSSPWTFNRICILCVPLLIAIGVAVFLYLFFSGNADNIPFFGDGENDPFNGKPPGDASQWKSGGDDGLELELLNALDSTWQDEYVQAVSDWENGTPDALTLSSTRIDHESRCTPEPGKMKVCNGNYGETGWRGINQIILQNGWITNSVAKLNDHYLGRASNAERLYTCCHELGHGYGLPHTDEIFTNPDLGNCMDYTNTPKNNMQPDESNFNLLADLYGVVDGDPPPNRYLASKATRDLESQECSQQEVMVRYEAAVAAFETGTQHNLSNCRLVKENEFSSAWQVILSEKCGMQVNVLRAQK